MGRVWTFLLCNRWFCRMDLRAAVEEVLTLNPMERKAVPTGLCVAIPAGWEGQIRPRSGLALRQGLSMPNAPGTIDADYRGELQVFSLILDPIPLRLKEVCGSPRC